MLSLSYRQRMQATYWLNGSNVGLSSKAILLNVAFGLKMPDYPHDPSDFRRCVIVLEKLPFLRKDFKRIMARVSPTWKTYIAHWDKMMKIYEREIQNDNGKAPDLFAYMQTLRGV